MVIKTRSTNHVDSRTELINTCLSKAEGLSPFRPRRRLMFVDKVFHGQRIYLDPKGLNNISIPDLEKNIISLGGSIERFLSKDVTCVVTDKKEIETANSNIRSSNETASSFNAPTLSRGQSLLARANANQRQNNSSVKTARQLGIKIVEVTKFLKQIKTELLKCDPNAKWTQEEIDCAIVKDKSNSIKTKRLKDDFIKHEDNSKDFRPVFGQILKRPCFNFNPIWGGCPFDKDHKPLFSSTDSLENLQSSVISKRTVDVEGKLSSMYKQSTKPKKKLKKKAAGPKAGYCESCNETFKDLKAHVASKTHLSFISNIENFSCLDTFICTLPVVHDLDVADSELTRKSKHQYGIPDETTKKKDVLTTEEQMLCDGTHLFDGIKAHRIESQSTPCVQTEFCNENVSLVQKSHKSDPVQDTGLDQCIFVSDLTKQTKGANQAEEFDVSKEELVENVNTSPETDGTHCSDGDVGDTHKSEQDALVRNVHSNDKMCVVNDTQEALCKLECKSRQPECNFSNSIIFDGAVENNAMKALSIDSIVCDVPQQYQNTTVLNKNQEANDELQKGRLHSDDRTISLPNIDVMNYSDISTPENSEADLASISTAIKSLDNHLNTVNSKIDETDKGISQTIPLTNKITPKQFRHQNMPVDCDHSVNEADDNCLSSVCSQKDILSFAVFDSLRDEKSVQVSACESQKGTTQDSRKEHSPSVEMTTGDMDILQTISHVDVQNLANEQNEEHALKLAQMTAGEEVTIGFKCDTEPLPRIALELPPIKDDDIQLAPCDIMNLLPEIHPEKVTGNSSTIPYGLSLDSEMENPVTCDFSLLESSLGPPTLEKHSSFKSRCRDDRSSFCIDSLLSSTGPPILEKQVMHLSNISSDSYPLDETLVAGDVLNTLMQENTVPTGSLNSESYIGPCEQHFSQSQDGAASKKPAIRQMSVPSQNTSTETNSPDDSSEGSEFDVMEYNRQVARQARLHFSDISDASVDYRYATPDTGLPDNGILDTEDSVSLQSAQFESNDILEKHVKMFSNLKDTIAVEVGSQSVYRQHSASHSICSSSSKDDCANQPRGIARSESSSSGDTGSSCSISFPPANFTRSSQESRSALITACRQSHETNKPEATSPIESNYNGDSRPQSELCELFDDSCALAGNSLLTGLDILQQISADISESSNHSVDVCLVPKVEPRIDLISSQECSAFRCDDATSVSLCYSDSSRESADPCLIRNEQEVSSLSDSRAGFSACGNAVSSRSASKRPLVPVGGKPHFAVLRNSKPCDETARAPFSDISNDSVSSLDNTLIAHGSELSFTGSCINAETETLSESTAAAKKGWSQSHTKLSEAAYSQKSISSGYHSELHAADVLHPATDSIRTARKSSKPASKKSKSDKENATSRKRRREACDSVAEPEAKRRLEALELEVKRQPEPEMTRRPVRNAAVVARMALNVLRDDAEVFHDQIQCDIYASRKGVSPAHAQDACLKSGSKANQRYGESVSRSKPSPYARLKKEPRRNNSESETSKSSDIWTASVVSGLKLKLSRGYSSSGSVSSPCHDFESDTDTKNRVSNSVVNTPTSRFDSWSVQKSSACKLTLSAKLLKSQAESRQTEGKKSRKRKLVYD